MGAAGRHHHPGKPVRRAGAVVDTAAGCTGCAGAADCTEVAGCTGAAGYRSHPLDRTGCPADIKCVCCECMLLISH